MMPTLGSLGTGMEGTPVTVGGTLVPVSPPMGGTVPTNPVAGFSTPTLCGGGEVEVGSVSATEGDERGQHGFGTHGKLTEQQYEAAQHRDAFAQKLSARAAASAENTERQERATRWIWFPSRDMWLCVPTHLPR